MCLFSTNPALYSTCMCDKIHLKCYVIVLHFLSFSLFSFFSSVSSTRRTVSWKMLALDIHSTVLFIGILLMSSLILLNKKELYEEHVQNSYSDRKGSNKVYQGSYKKTCYLQLSVGGDNQKYNPHKNTTPGGPLSSMMAVITYKPVKNILISTRTKYLLARILIVFLPKCRARNWKRETGSQCIAIICIRI